MGVVAEVAGELGEILADIIGALAEVIPPVLEALIPAIVGGIKSGLAALMDSLKGNEAVVAAWLSFVMLVYLTFILIQSRFKSASSDVMQ